MSDWLDFFRGMAPRDDVQSDFPAANIEQEQPVWISREEVLAGAAIAARVLETVANRGGTRLGASAFTALRRAVANGLDESARNLCEDEARRVLRWLEEAREAALADSDEPPEVDVMYASDLESRVSVAQFAIEEGFDLEMEYYDDERETWPRLRCEPLSVKYESDDVDEDVSLRFEGQHGEREVALRQVRWLMPVERRPRHLAGEKKEPGEVIRFPVGRSLDENDE